MRKDILAKIPFVIWTYNAKEKIKKDIKKRIENKSIMQEWEKKGRPSPPPPIFKRELLKRFGKDFSLHVFVETGTSGGGTVDAVKQVFKKIYSIELDLSLYKRAYWRFAKYKHIRIIHGDSGKVLPDILKNINEPCLFWLDAHYSGGSTAKGDLDTPILNELQHIFDHQIDRHIILIDDAWDFRGQNDYPTLSELEKFVRKRLSDLIFEVEDNIIRIMKKRDNLGKLQESVQAEKD